MASVDQTSGLEGQKKINSSRNENDLFDHIFRFFLSQLVFKIENSKY